MNSLKIFLIVLFFLFNIVQVCAQRTIRGKVIDENQDILIGAKVYNNDTIEIGKVDLDGSFEVKVPEESNRLIFGSVGYEYSTISVLNKCHYLEVILLYDGIYHYKSHRKIDRLRKRRFNELSKIHLDSFKKGIFKEKIPCGKREFVPIKKVLDEIRMYRKAKTE